MKKTRAIAIFLTCITAASMGATILTGCSGGKDSSTSSSEVSVRAIQDDELESQTDSDSEAIHLSICFVAFTYKLNSLLRCDVSCVHSRLSRS